MVVCEVRRCASPAPQWQLFLRRRHHVCGQFIGGVRRVVFTTPQRRSEDPVGCGCRVRLSQISPGGITLAALVVLRCVPILRGMSPRRGVTDLILHVFEIGDGPVSAVARHVFSFGRA